MINKMSRRVPIDNYKGAELNLSEVLSKLDEMVDVINEIDKRVELNHKLIEELNKRPELFRMR